MTSRTRVLVGILWLPMSVAWSQSTASHSVSRANSDLGPDSTATHVAIPTIGSPMAMNTHPPQDSLPTGSDSIQSEVRKSAIPDSSKRTGAHFRAGLHASSKDIGLMIGGSIRAQSISFGMDGWIRPGTFTQEVRITPTRRAQYKELIWGFDPWIQWEIGSRTRVALTAALDIATGMWYGTSQSPGTDVQPALGLKVLFPWHSQVGLRRTFNPGLLGSWRGEVACEF
ncbi:MAG: hypothetical protein IPN71_11285 [Fibrobacteres bacterium]|nr:hypothetical protein [Fibrobacterota bacterium]